MESTILHILVDAGEAVLCGLALGAVLLLVRRIQIAFGVKETKGQSTVSVSRA